ncbi:Uncharacterised protein [Citrobacter youngae]|uniref:Uncharacterized protein n=1 Tax=Citrobacter youngae TaxID=133448 RepID=A0A9Q7ZSP2_9ENTR|nr:Uncharacterised protein [Citrobacter youngae]
MCLCMWLDFSLIKLLMVCIWPGYQIVTMVICSVKTNMDCMWLRINFVGTLQEIPTTYSDAITC